MITKGQLREHNADGTRLLPTFLYILKLDLIIHVYVPKV